MSDVERPIDGTSIGIETKVSVMSFSFGGIGHTVAEIKDSSAILNVVPIVIQDKFWTNRNSVSPRRYSLVGEFFSRVDVALGARRVPFADVIMRNLAEAERYRQKTCYYLGKYDFGGRDVARVDSISEDINRVSIKKGPERGGFRIEPSALFDLRFIQLPLHGRQLAIADDRLRDSYQSSNNGEYRNPNSGGGRSAGRTILGAFFFALGAALMKLAFNFGDTPRSQRNDWWLTSGTGVCAGLMLAQGTILIIFNTWIP
jgi:hypothetical protein